MEQHLVFRSLETNRFEGEIPAKLGKLIKLERLYGTSIELCFVICEVIPIIIYPLNSINLGRFSFIDYSILSANRLSGKFPLELYSLTNLRQL